MNTRMRVLGAMSGTSLDGVDWAVIETNGKAITGFGPSGYRAYSTDEQALLRAALGQWDGPEVTAAADLVTRAHVEALSEAGPVDLMGFHGQTLAHDPGGRGTLQVGDGAALARALSAPVAWDFRSGDVAAGGQGAPLAPFYHFACAQKIGAQAPLAFLNMGGVGNLTWVDPMADAPETPGALLAFDTGPANAPLNDLMLLRCGVGFDRDGALAAQGQVDAGAVAAFLTHPYFAEPAPKSLDRDSFADLPTRVAHLPDADAAATLLAMSAGAVAAGLALCPTRPEHLLVTGGGRLNPVLMAQLSASCGVAVDPIDAVGLDGDMLEAQAFAYLAMRVHLGLPLSAPMTTGVPVAMTGGRVSHP